MWPRANGTIMILQSVLDAGALVNQRLDHASGSWLFGSGKYSQLSDYDIVKI